MDVIQDIKEKLNSVKNCNLICRFERCFFQKDFVQSVFTVLNRHANIVEQFCSKYPDNFYSAEESICYVKLNNIDNFMNPEELEAFELVRDSYEEQVICDFFDDFFKDKLAIISPYYYYNEERNMFFKNGNIEFLIPVDDLNKDYMSIPKIQDKVPLEKINRGEYFVLPNWSKTCFGVPKYAYWHNSLYKVNLECSPENDSYWKTIDNESFVRLSLPIEDMLKNYILIGTINGDKPVIDDTISFVYLDKEALIDVKTEEIIEEEIEEETEKQVLDEVNSLVNDTSDDLYNFLEFTKQNHLCYTINDIFNFYTCVRTSQLIILAGMSGTGKTRLPLKFAEYFNMSEEKETLLFLPVSPSFTEPSDVLGFINPNSEKYVPSETGLVDFLIHAMKNPENMHMVIFDEMNLSQIEHWFAPFISLLEKDYKNRKLRLYSENQKCTNCASYPSVIDIGNNIIFIGTINLDETTKNISDRVIDRSFVINLKKDKFTNYLSQQNEVYDKINTFEGDFYSKVKDFNVDNFNYITSFEYNELEFFDKLHKELYSIDNQKGISFRCLRNIALFMNRKPNEMSKETAFDYAFKQTVLKKINGTIEGIGEFIGTTLDEDEQSNGILSSILNEYSAISDFTESKKEIANKVRELIKYGFTK